MGRVKPGLSSSECLIIADFVAHGVCQPAADCLAVGFILCRVTHPWTLNPAASKYYRRIWLAAGFQKRLVTPASYQMHSHMYNRILYWYEKRPSNIVWILQFLLENGKKCTFSYKVTCKNCLWLGQRGGSHRAPP